MNITETIIYFAELVGVVAFSISGAMVAIKQQMDIFGVFVLAITTAVGGGVLRDLILGINPPLVFSNPVHVITSILTAFLIFSLFYFKKHFMWLLVSLSNLSVLNIFDAIGLAVFCIVGVNAAINAGFVDNKYLLIFVGTMTGVGGGIMRDIMAGNVPIILRKRIYAVAAIVGSAAYAFMYEIISEWLAMFIGCAIIITIRMLATFLKWTLPIASAEYEDDIK